jgi:hypothetical protein
MFEKEGNERKAQAGFAALHKRSHQPDRLFMQGRVPAFPAHDEVHAQRMKGIRQLIACVCGCLAHK